MIFDTHAHYDDEQFDKDRKELLGAMQEKGIGHIVNCCASAEEIEKTVALTEEYSFIYGAVGVHPDDAGKMEPQIMERLKRFCSHEKTVAVGEIGLDYYWHKDDESRRIQQKWFRRQMELAKEEQLPFIIHSREAAEDTLQIVRDFMKDGMYGGIIHCFSYGKEIAREYLNMGLHLGIGGVVTFKNARKLKEVVEYAPMEQLVLETDCPYLAPEPNRGKRNSSLNLPYVAEAIGQIKGMTPEEVVKVTDNNAKKLFHIPN